MSEPKYSEGQPVAVCKMVGDETYVNPYTSVARIRGFYRRGQFLAFRAGQIITASLTGFYYELADGCITHEQWLRPIEPETEYLAESERACEVSL